VKVGFENVATVTGKPPTGALVSSTARAKVKVAPPKLDRFLVSAPASATAGSAFSVTVTARDQFGTTFSGYRGTVHITTTDRGSGIVLPANYTFRAGDHGVHTFRDGVTLMTAGAQTVSATATSGSKTGSSRRITVSAGAATHLTVTAAATSTAGSAFSVTVTARDAAGNTATGYRGTVHFTTSGGGATTVPPDYTFVAGDQGAHVFSNAVTLVTAGGQTVTATDTTSSTITGTSGSITVSAGAATHLTVGAPATATAGTAFGVTVTALDAYGNTATGYAGTVHFTGTDSGAMSVLPADYTFVAGDGGAHTFGNAVTLVTAAAQTVTATDSGTSSITGTSGSITVSPAAATHFTVTAPASATAGGAVSVTVTALDAYANIAVGYTGTVHFTSSDAGAAATLPADYTFVAGDNGAHTFTNAVTLVTAGTQTVTATDSSTSSITGTSGTIAVSAGAATHLTLTAPATATRGSAFSVTVTAQDQFGNTAGGYTGTVHFTSSDGAATLPANYTFVSADNGAHTFTSAVTLNTTGTRTVTATDTATASITGTTGGITVSP
jgi:hypothetical protein